MNENKKRDVIVDSMKYLKFGYPVTRREEFDEVIKICMLHHHLKKDGFNDILNKLKGKNALDISLSLTDCCGHMCRHCSTNASLGRDSVLFANLEKALSEMAPYTKSLNISCEGDPFYYKDTQNGSKKNIVDVLKLLVGYKFDYISFQSMAPSAKKFPLLKEMLRAINLENKECDFFFPYLSFNLYSSDAGLKVRNHADKTKGEDYRFQELYIPGVKGNEVREWFSKLISRGQIAKGDNIPEKTLEVSEKLAQYLNDVKSAVLAYARQSYNIHFEIRGDSLGEVTNLKTTNHVMDKLLENLSKEHPEVNFPMCDICSKVHYEKNSHEIAPIGRAASLFPEGRKKQEYYIDKHVNSTPYKYLCDNWTSWGSMTIDTKGFPQLCYSNVSLTPKIRITKGINLYSDGFKSIKNLYLQVWKLRAKYLLKNLPALVQRRPNDNYCPHSLFRTTVEKNTESKQISYSV